jgi:hypothetical protein
MGEMKKRTKALIRNLRDDNRTLGDSVADGLKAADVVESLAALTDNQAAELRRLKDRLAKAGMPTT